MIDDIVVEVGKELVPIFMDNAANYKGDG